MKREFSIVEVMLDGVSGQVDGVVAVNEWTGAVEEVDCCSFEFVDDATGDGTLLTQSQRQSAHKVVSHILAAETELNDQSDRYAASAASYVSLARQEMTAAEKILADYLENVRPAKPDDSAQRADRAESGIRRFG